MRFGLTVRWVASDGSNLHDHGSKSGWPDSSCRRSLITATIEGRIPSRPEVSADRDVGRPALARSAILPGSWLPMSSCALNSTNGLQDRLRPKRKDGSRIVFDVRVWVCDPGRTRLASKGSDLSGGALADRAKPCRVHGSGALIRPVRRSRRSMLGLIESGNRLHPGRFVYCADGFANSLEIMEALRRRSTRRGSAFL